MGPMTHSLLVVPGRILRLAPEDRPQALKAELRVTPVRQ